MIEISIPLATPFRTDKNTDFYKNLDLTSNVSIRIFHKYLYSSGLGSPYFQPPGGGKVNVTTQLESSTYLDCHVNRLGGKTVSTTSSHQ